MIPKEYVEYFKKWFEEVGIVKLGGGFTFPDGEEFPIAQLIIEASKGET